MSTSTTPKAPSSIPNITTLRNELDYGDIRLPRCAAFIDDTNAFRRKFKTSRGVDGVDLHDWKSRDGQAGLQEMTIAYLDTEGNGRIFWPDDRSSKNYNNYQYSKDRPRIVSLVKQLFFRLNQQQFRNHKYKHKTNLETYAQDERGSSEQTAIDVDSITFNPTTPYGEPHRARIFTEDSLPDFEKFYDEQHPEYNRQIPDSADVYEVPISNSPPPPGIRQFEAINQPPRTKRDPVPDDAADCQQRKRQKRQPKAPLTNDTYPEPAKTSPGSADRQRKSSRTKKQPRYDGYHGLAEMNRIMSPDRFATPRLRSPSSPPRASTPEASTITSKALASTSTESAALDTAAPHPNPGRQQEFPPTVKQPPSGVPLGGESENGPGPEPERLSPVVPRSPNKTKDSRDSASHPQDVGQPKPSMQQPSKSPTPGAAGATAHGPSSGGSSSKPKPPVNFMYRVLLSRTPKRIAQRWNPRGRFQDKTLAELLKELPFHDGEVQGLTFTIESECMSTVEHILSDDEDSFASMKRYISMEIRKWFVRQQHLGGGKPPRLAVDILIEQMSQDHQQDVDGLDELELEW